MVRLDWEIIHDSHPMLCEPLLVHQRGTRILGGESKTDFLSNFAMFYQANPYFGAKLSSFVAILTKTTTM